MTGLGPQVTPPEKRAKGRPRGPSEHQTLRSGLLAREAGTHRKDPGPERVTLRAAGGGGQGSMLGAGRAPDLQAHGHGHGCLRQSRVSVETRAAGRKGERRAHAGASAEEDDDCLVTGVVTAA